MIKMKRLRIKTLYDVVYEDLREVIGAFLSAYSHPDEYKSNYYFDGAKKNINRKAALTELMSDICDAEFSMTPVIINEAVNRNEITSIANNSRSKIVSALLRNQLEPNLGLSGTGQEVSIMRSTLIRTGIWDESAGMPVINLHPQDTKLANMMGTIEQFILGARRNGAIGFDVLYDMLSLPEYHIGLRKGLIPIYLAAAMHEYRQQLIIADKYGQLAMTADTLLQINANPSAFTLAYIDWDPQKEDFISTMAEVFSAYAALWIVQNISREQPTQRPLIYYPVHKREGYFSTYPLLKANGCIGCSELQDWSRAVNMVMDKLQCDEKEASSVILESIPVESIDTLIEFGLNNANDDYYDDVYLADGCSTCKTEIFRSFLTQVATNTDEIFFELSNKLLRQALDEQLSKLTLKEAEVIKLRYGYYGKERTLEEVGKQFGVTRERIRQIETKAIRKLRHPSRAKHLRDFL